MAESKKNINFIDLLQQEYLKAAQSSLSSSTCYFLKRIL